MLSRIEKLTRNYLKNCLRAKSIYNHRPDWLKNPKTGKNLELDIFYPDLKLAIEVNGFTHRLKIQKERDALRLAKCNEQKIILIIVNDKKELLALREKIRDVFRQNNFDRSIIKYKKMPKKLLRRISLYKSGKNSMGKVGKAINYRIKCEEAGDVQRMETEGVRKRMLLKNGGE